MVSTVDHLAALAGVTILQAGGTAAAAAVAAMVRGYAHIVTVEDGQPAGAADPRPRSAAAAGY